MSSPKSPPGRGLVAKVSVFFKGLGKDQKAEDKLAVQRLRTVRRSAVCAEVTSPEDNFATKVVPKNDEAQKRLKNALQNNYLFANLDEEQTKIVVDAVEEEKHKAGDVIISQGDPGDQFHLLEDGTCEMWLLKPGKTTPELVKHYAAGDSFGELALLYGAPRAASVKAMMRFDGWGSNK
ncbi:hypothetical protein L7F22_049907 [Adiantum nelumboides]|nr:hypothetical protein [Adiantum nelumboides]